MSSIILAKPRPLIGQQYDGSQYNKKSRSYVWARTELEQHVKERIREEGPVTFAQFMQMALYHVPGGYYTSDNQPIGPQGDFYTGPLAHPIFGALIAIQIEQIWETLGAPSYLQVAEIGSGKGSLARDILAYSRHLSPTLEGALRYLTVERSRPRSNICWDAVASIDLPLRHLRGCIISNELLDAMPVHRVVRRGGALKEIYVGLEDEGFTEIIDEPSTSRLQQRLENLGVSLEEGQEAEVNLLLEDWMRNVAIALDHGYVISIDYGYPAAELYSPVRTRGTLICYYRHTTNRNPLTRVGQQDITAHVDLSSIVAIGEKYGLQVCGVVSQAQFLANLGIRAFIERLNILGLQSGEYYANRLGMRNLIDPEGLGNFRVIIQRKGQASDNLYGLHPERPERWRVLAEKEDLHVPLLSTHHIDLLQGRYPHLAWSPQE